jgi:hypothetical protein
VSRIDRGQTNPKLSIAKLPDVGHHMAERTVELSRRLIKLNHIQNKSESDLNGRWNYKKRRD